MTWTPPNRGKTTAGAPGRSSFRTIGTEVAKGVRAVQPQRGRSVPKKGGVGGMLEAATATHRRGIQERMGAQFAPTAVLYKQNAAEASATQRNVRIVPSAVGNRDFYLRRQY